MNINIENFMKYFFFGLENKREIIKLIILNVAKNMGEQRALYDDRNEPITFYELEKNMIKNLIVQLERFTTLHDFRNDYYSYDIMQINSKCIEDLYQFYLNELKRQWAVVPCTYRPYSALYFTDDENRMSKEPIIEKRIEEDGSIVEYKIEHCTGERKLQSIGDWAKEEVYPILEFLQELEHKSKIEYYSLFLDCKYARAINRRVKSDIKDDKELKKIEEVYRLFLNRGQVSAIDIILKLEGSIDEEVYTYIRQKYPEYDTITPLKDNAMDERYKQRVEDEVAKVEEYAKQKGFTEVEI